MLQSKAIVVDKLLNSGSRLPYMQTQQLKQQPQVRHRASKSQLEGSSSFAFAATPPTVSPNAHPFNELTSSESREQEEGHFSKMLSQEGSQNRAWVERHPIIITPCAFLLIRKIWPVVPFGMAVALKWAGLRGSCACLYLKSSYEKNNGAETAVTNLIFTQEIQSEMDKGLLRTDETV